MKSLLRVFMLQLMVLSYTSLQAQWVYTGGPGGGIVGCFAFTHEGSGETRIFAGTDRGVYISTDYGSNWTSANSGMPAYAEMTALLAVPGDAGGACLFAAVFEEGVLRSTDGGLSWTPASAGLPSTLFNSSLTSVQDQTGKTILFVAFGYGGGGIYRSTDLGTNWSRVTEGLPQYIEVTSLGLCSNSAGDTAIVAGTWGGIYRSMDEGLTWDASPSGPAASFAGFVSVDTNVFVGTDYGVYLSTDCGWSWEKKSEGLPVSTNPEGHTFVRTLAGVPNDAGGTSLFAGIGGSVFVSIDTGRSWSALDSDLPHDNLVFSMGVCDSLFFVGILQRGVFLSTDCGDTWVKRDNGIPNSYLTSLAAAQVGQDSILLFVGTRDAGILSSSDDGASWIPVNNGQLDTLVTCLAVSPNKVGGVDLYSGTGTRGVFHSSDNGESWSVMNSNWLDGTIYISAIAIADGGTESSQIFAATSDGMYLSTDGGSRWTAVNNGLPVYYYDYNGARYHYLFTSLATARSAEATDFVFVGSEYGVYRTTNNGSSWERANDGLTDANVKALAVFSLEGQQCYVLAATPSGIFSSTDYGATWSLADSSILGTPISSVVSCGTNVYVLTAGSGIWKRPASQLVSTDVDRKTIIPQAFSLYQNYPNPFNPTTTISYELSANCFVSLKVYDVLGREVKTLVNEVKRVGRYEVKFDASGLASGVYFYRLTAGNFIATNKMILIR